jgi:type I restriction enzyme S subunit
MAKEKKSTPTLTVEEKLQAALVPKDEQPYKIPDTWRWIYAPSIFKIEYGKGLSSKQLEESGFPVFGANGLIGYYSEYMYDDEQALMSCRGAYSGVMNKSVPKSYVTSNSLVISSETKDITADYICYLFSALDVSRLISGSAQPQVTVQSFEKFPIPLPPIKEQQRIVARIESLFSQLDEAKDKAQEVIDGFDSRRAAILAQAFSGKLTEKWRRENDVKNSWELKRFNEVADIRSNLVDPAEYENFPHIAPDNIEKRTGVLLEYHTIAEDGVTSGKHRFYPGQILYSKIRPYLSKVVMVDFDGLCSADMYPIEAKQNTRFLWYYMLSDEFLEAASSAGSRSVLPKINQKELSKIPICITQSEDEQAEVVRILDEILAKENETRILAETVVDKTEEIKKSVLAKAFRGELGTHDSSEASALDELKNILSKEERTMPKAKSVRIPKNILNMLETETEKKIVRYIITNDRAVSLEDISGLASDTFEIIENVSSLEKKQVIKKLKNGLYRMIDENAN